MADLDSNTNSSDRLTLKFDRGEELIIANKPAGFPTHAVDVGKYGLAELVEKELLAQGKQEKLHVAHRLDKTTTGVLLFATSEPMTKKLYAAFKIHTVYKRYLFLTTARPEQTEFHIFSKIEKVGNQIQNTTCPQELANAETYFLKIKLNAKFQLWEAVPKTGKTHQIRLHAAQAKIPILGDTLYGGQSYPHLCLHASELEIPGIGKWACLPPIFFERMGLLRDAKLVALLSAADRRQRLYAFLEKPNTALRLSHQDQEKFRIDIFGEIIWVYWYSELPPRPEELERFEFLEGLLKKKILIRRMQNRGQDSHSKNDWAFSEIPSSWVAEENGLKFELRKNQGLSPGLFLDQRENRAWMIKNAKNKRVLNLFSYTCGFSVAAAKGQAKEIVSVDLSKNFLEWGKRNFSLNGIVINTVLADPQQIQFFAQDSLQFLAGAKRRNREFDIIICDPPSFARDGKNVFKIDKNLPELLTACFDCLSAGGILLCSTNYEKWSMADFKQIIIKTLEKQIERIETPTLLPLDFELPMEPPLMKTFFVYKK